MRYFAGEACRSVTSDKTACEAPDQWEHIVLNYSETFDLIKEARNKAELRLSASIFLIGVSPELLGVREMALPGSCHMFPDQFRCAMPSDGLFGTGLCIACTIASSRA